MRQRRSWDLESPHARGEQSVLMVAVQFPDVKPKVSLAADLEERAVKRLGAYVKEQSYGLTWIKPDFMGWVLLPGPIAEYRISPDNFQVDALGGVYHGKRLVTLRLQASG